MISGITLDNSQIGIILPFLKHWQQILITPTDSTVCIDPLVITMSITPVVYHTIMGSTCPCLQTLDPRRIAVHNMVWVHYSMATHLCVYSDLVRVRVCRYMWHFEPLLLQTIAPALTCIH